MKCYIKTLSASASETKNQYGYHETNDKQKKKKMEWLIGNNIHVGLFWEDETPWTIQNKV